MQDEVKGKYKVLRLHKGTQAGDDWHVIPSNYTENDIEQINDPSGATSKKQITSIPSPFARIHLFETAFKIVVSDANKDISSMNGNTIYHRLVSECFDVGETFFNYDIFKRNEKVIIEILTWNKNNQISELKNSEYPQHKLLGETMELFLNQDSASSNFQKMQNIHMISYDFKIIGGTSPTTLFYSSPDDLMHVDLKQGNHSFFDQGNFLPLHKRSMEFQRYLHKMFKVYPELQTDMPLVWEYLKVSLKAMEQDNMEHYRELMAITNDGDYNIQKFQQDYEEANTGKAGAVLDVFNGIEHRKKKLESVDGTSSDFTIKSSKYKEGKIPMALQNNYRRALSYINGIWNSDTVVPFKDDNPLEGRFLPGQNEQYPYLTVSDFLEPTLVRLVYSIDNRFFFDGNPIGFQTGDRETLDPPEPGFLLPLKKFFFKFFEKDYLTSSTPGGKPVFSIVKEGDDAVRVELRIPIKKDGEYILFDRLYKLNVEPDEHKNVGNIVQNRFSLGFLPFVSGEECEHQRIVLVDRDVTGNQKQNEYEVSFFTENSLTPLVPPQETVRSDKNKPEHVATTHYYVMEDAYDYLEVSSGNQRGIVIPSFPASRKGGDQFTFAVDFGTTNSHIEYSVGKGEPRPFEISKNEIQLITFFDSFWEITDNIELQDLLLYELMPELIGGNSLYNFPMRTAVGEVKNLNHNQGTFALGDINIPFTYEKKPNPGNTVVTTNLKWAKLSEDDGARNDNRVNAYLETLMILVRNKVLLNGGNLESTKLVWFYPSSMSYTQKGKYEKKWKKLFNKYINPNENPISYSESEVPFYKHSSNVVQSSVYPVMNIDIGGGTTDIVVFEKGRPQFLTSVKFAGNVVFGDAYDNGFSTDNGFITVFKSHVEKLLNQNTQTLYELKQVFDQLNEGNKTTSADLMAFFFSIEKNKQFQNARLNFSVTELIADDEDFKIVFVVFYGAIIYHVAKLMKKVGMKMPRNICLSGNGSKIINLLDASTKLKSVEKLSKYIFEKVYGETYHDDGLDMIQDSEPKEATCKGGIKKAHSNNSDDNDFDMLVLLGDDEDTLVNEEKHNYDRFDLKYKDIQEFHLESTVKEVKDFVDLLIGIHDEFSFSKNFGIQSGRLEEYREVLKKDLLSYLMEGLSRRKELASDADFVAETLFFYPLIGSLYRLTRSIAENR